MSAVAALALAACASVPTAGSSAWKSYPNGAVREAITCPTGTRKVVGADTYLALFGAAWKDQPEAKSRQELRWPAAFGAANLVDPNRDRGHAIVAVLVGADGKIVSAQVTCSSKSAIVPLALQAAEAGRYRPARVAGRTILSFVKRPVDFGP